MVLPKDPRLMSDEELSDWAVSLIGRKAPESNFLDYKREVSIKGEKDKIEVCKDVSSFANENGGILLYGVPELKESGIPVPADLSVCGFDMPMDLPKRIEDILIDVIEPPLPELSIRVLKPKKLKPKSLLFIHHPESWNKPHMVQAYNDFRFYRRGEFQSALMTEKQVEAAYAFRKSSLDNAGRFFETGDFRAFPTAGRFLRVVLCPRFTILRREAMAPSKFLAWRTKNSFPKGGDWLPFLDGWRFQSRQTGEFHEKLYEFRLFHNGAISYTRDLTKWLEPPDPPFQTATEGNQGDLNLNSLEDDLRNTFIPFSLWAFEFLNMKSPLSVQISLFNVERLNAFIRKTAVAFGENGETALEKPEIAFVEETSVSELEFSQEQVLGRLISRLASAFGISRE